MRSRLQCHSTHFDLSNWRTCKQKEKARKSWQASFNSLATQFMCLYETNIYYMLTTVFLIQDVYGCIKSVKVPHEQPLRNKNKVETKCEITVQNLRYSVCCYLHTVILLTFALDGKLISCSICRRETLNITLWGDIARSFDIGTVQRSPPPVLAVFTSLLLAEYNGNHSPQTTRYFTTAIYTN